MFELFLSPLFAVASVFPYVCDFLLRLLWIGEVMAAEGEGDPIWDWSVSPQFPWRRSDLPWLHVAASDLHRGPAPDMEDWRLLMQKPLLIRRMCAIQAAALASSLSSLFIKSSLF